MLHVISFMSASINIHKNKFVTIEQLKFNFIQNVHGILHTRLSTTSKITSASIRKDNSDSRKKNLLPKASKTTNHLTYICVQPKVVEDACTSFISPGCVHVLSRPYFPFC